MEQALEREGETRPIHEILSALANSLRLADFFPWSSVEEFIDQILDHPTTGHATVASLRAAGGFLPLHVPHVAYADRNFDSPSGKIEFYSSRAQKVGLPPLPVHGVLPDLTWLIEAARPRGPRLEFAMGSVPGPA